MPDAPDLAALMPFVAHLGIKVELATPEEVRGSLSWSEELCTGDGILHGGALVGLADSVGAVCAFLNLPEGASTATISSTTSFLRAVRDGTVSAIARPLHVGGSAITVQTDVIDAEGRRAAQTTQVQAVLRPR